MMRMLRERREKSRVKLRPRSSHKTISIEKGSSRRSSRRKRKRTAVALGVSAIGLSGASNLAISAEILAAQGIANMSNAGQSPYDLFDPQKRQPADRLEASDRLIKTMIEEEGVRYSVYRDVAGYPTVGVGHLVRPHDGLKVGDRITHGKALEFLQKDIKKAEQGARDLVGRLPVNQHEFDALVDLVFNVGPGTVSKDKSPRLNAAINAGDYDRVAQELDYTTAGNRVAPGLIHRSERRTNIFAQGDYSDPRES